MSRRIEIELTSARADGTWTWRAAGAKKPKGDVDGSVLPAGAKVGDVLRVDTETDIEGVSITAVLPPKGARTEPERLEVVGSRRTEESLVTTALVEKRARSPRDRERGPRDRDRNRDRPEGARARGPRPDRPPRDGARPDGTAPRPSRPRTEGQSERPARRERPAPAPAPPKAARLRPGRTHRNAVLAELPEEQKPIAEQILRGGIPAVRQAVEKQNESARAEGLPEVKADALLGLAEQLLPRLRTAEWLDKAEAALKGIAELDLRDLRTVVVAADAAARDDETRALAQQLRDALTARVDGEHHAWLAELAELVRDGRTVRALRLSSHPPKAGAPLPADLAEQLARVASEGLTAEITQDRWATLVDAVAFSPVRLNVTPVGVPANPNDELKATIAKVGARVPQIAALLGVTPQAPASRRPGGPVRGRRPAGGARPLPPKPALPAPAKPAAVAAEPTPAPAEPTEAPVATPADRADEVAPAPASGDEDVAPAPASGDGPQDSVLVEELGESVDQQ